MHDQRCRLAPLAPDDDATTTYVRAPKRPEAPRLRPPRPRRPAGDADQTALSTLSTAGESNGIDDKHIGAPFEEEKGAGSTGAYQSDLKEQGDREPDRTQAIQIAESLLSTISAKPALCREPCLQGVLRLCRQIGSDSVKYPCTPGVASVPLSAASTPVPELTKDLGRRLYDREDLRLSDGFALQITHQEEDKVVGLNVRGSGIGDNEVRDVSFRRWKFNAVDGDGTVITIRVDSTLSAEAKFLSPGTIFTSSTAFPVYVNYGDEYNMRCGIVLSEFSIIGHAAPPIPADVTPARLIVKPREITASSRRGINETLDFFVAVAGLQLASVQSTSSQFVCTGMAPFVQPAPGWTSLFGAGAGARRLEVSGFGS
ncbi:hypothetical protein THAOC_32322 [Thalassiosira oceanica]|uniref:Uncharacterized protein n=1 Tax=Thalassiosira oceanica TaxID=159749 RepID=K0RQ70_THAOC|nr:hypothetical protein THAOC_32322 [Thalassiosira oceanica]|eukprot:EJK48847.1 hypothetical protein THAOC_32322 [Thalassiosira oceanica]